MKEKIKILILILFMSTSTVSFAQKGNMKEKIKTLKIAFITEKLDFTSAEAEIFWPIYNNYEKKMDKLRESKYEGVYNKMKDLDKLSDNQAEKSLNLYLSIEEKEKELNEVFYKKLSKAISAKKAFILIKTEKEFKRHLIEEYRRKKGSH